MYWPKFSKKAFFRKLYKSRRTPSGVSCAYVQWTKYVGLKMFTSKRSMSQSYKGQKRAAKHKLAPRVGERLTVDVIRFSEVSNSLGFCDSEAPIPSKLKIHCFFTETATGIGRRVSRARERDLKKRLEEIGICHGDLHQWNIGRIGKRLVYIDFDDASCEI